MNERYRYGYGEDFPNRDFPFSRQGAMTDHREDEPARRDAATDERDDDEDDAEQRQADRIREAEAGARSDEAGEREREREGAAASTRSDSVFEVEEEPDHPARPAVYQPQPERPATARGEAAPATRSEERPPIALGPPSPSPAPAPATVAPAPPPAAAAAPAAAPRPQAEPVGERTSLLASIDRDSVRSRFLDIQAGFVDEPRQAVQEAERFVDELVQQLLRALEGERTKLKAAIDDGSTEDLRLALRGYRGFVDRLLNLTM